MHIIGICGGIASGKSLVTDQFHALGAAILDADKAGHQVLKESAVIEILVERWGAKILDEQNQVVRSVVAKIVFAPHPAGPQELAFLEQTTHPQIGKRLKQQLNEFKYADMKAVILDAPVMFKAGWDGMCDTIVFVDAPRAIRLDRAKNRGWSEADFDAREAAQESLEVKRSRADLVIDNSGSQDQTAAQIEELWNKL
ncbi:MAG: dephospho-CoA kinase [Pirellulaceae bacterium]|jgi:dephospho-CoA kinase